MPKKRIASVLCIGGVDPSGGAGILADARACAAAGVHALSVATAIVAQNTRGVAGVEAASPAILRTQIESLLADIRPGAIKIGMIPNIAAIEVLSSLLRPLSGEIPIVIDTVFAPSTGVAFNDAQTIEVLKTLLLPLATVVTPNAIEAIQLGALTITDMLSMKRAAREIWVQSGSKNVLLKGGHVADEEFSIDLFFDGATFIELRARRESGYEVRGTGCLLASALASQLAKGKSPADAAKEAKNWLTRQFQEAQAVGGGRRIAAIATP